MHTSSSDTCSSMGCVGCVAHQLLVRRRAVRRRIVRGTVDRDVVAYVHPIAQCRDGLGERRRPDQHARFSVRQLRLEFGDREPGVQRDEDGAEKPGREQRFGECRVVRAEVATRGRRDPRPWREEHCASRVTRADSSPYVKVRSLVHDRDRDAASCGRVAPATPQDPRCAWRISFSTSPSNRAALSLRISGRTSGLMSSASKSASQRSGVMTG